VHLGGATPNPDSVWVAQRGRKLAMALQEEGRSPRFLIPTGTPSSPALRRGFPVRRHDDHPHPDPGPERQRVLRTVGGHGQGRVPGLDPGPRATTHGAGPSDLHRLRKSPSIWFVNNAATSRFPPNRRRSAGSSCRRRSRSPRDRGDAQVVERDLPSQPPCPARWTTLMPPRPISPSTLWPAISDPQVERLLDGRVR
jgi:hypothetical protein